MNNARSIRFGYGEAFSRNIGWVTEWEQQALRGKKVAIAGLGGVGGVHLLTLTRLGIGTFHIADLDSFDLANFNRQAGATLSTLGRPKAEVLAETARDINPEIDITCFGEGITETNIDAFLDGVDLFVDGLDFFVLDMRARVFARCAERGIPAITAAPLGMGTAYLIFMPGGMTFEEYFRLDGLPSERQYVNFLVGLNPKGYHRPYLMDPWRIDFKGRRGPSTAMACQLCAGVVGVEALKILLDRGCVRAAPHYHQFDAYRGKWVAGWLPGGNRHPLQVVKRHIGYGVFARLSQETCLAQTNAVGSEIEQILDLARWAPSGDNNQPWRFEIEGKDRIRVHVRDRAGEDVYEYNGGQPTLLAAGCLLESIRIAASVFGRDMRWHYGGFSGQDHMIDMELPKSRKTPEDPLHAFLTLRSVDRGRYRTVPLTPAQKQTLEDCLGDEWALEWFESRQARWRIARINAAATDIRLRIPEAFRVHQKILDWDRQFSPDGVPVTAVGLDRLTLKVMRWAMRNWNRMHRMNQIPGSTIGARLQLDYLPGLACAAHFVVTRKSVADAGDETHSLLRAGQALQRFWLTATRLGLVMQPSFAPLCFAHYGRHGVIFTGDAEMGRKAETLAAKVDGLCPGDANNLLFLGRLGLPVTRTVGARSVRRPLSDLLVSAQQRFSQRVA